MIPNDSGAKKRQHGIQKAYLTYEITVEGGITRLLALYKDATVEKIGPVRSSRHYYLDYAMENDAIYVHFGWSPQAESDMGLLGVNNINFMSYNGYTRDYSLGLASEHTAFTSMEFGKGQAQAIVLFVIVAVISLLHQQDKANGLWNFP